MVGNLGNGPIPALQKAHQAAAGYTYQKQSALFYRALPLTFTLLGTGALVYSLGSMYLGLNKKE